MLSRRLKGRWTPPVNTVRAQSDLFTVQCCHWDSQADIRKYKEIPVHIWRYRHQRQMHYRQVHQINLIARSTTMHIYRRQIVVKMAISHFYWPLVVKNGNFTFLLTSSGQEWQFYISTDIEWSRMAISHVYWHLVIKNGNFILLLTSHGQEWQFHIATDI